jgi:lipopolysaccharide export LptBFGC system permease protein LptF
MSIFRVHDPYGSLWAEDIMKQTERELELRRRANENLKKVYSGVYRREADAKRKAKLTELEKASAEDIERGQMVLEFRELRKIENRYARKQNLTDDDQAHWEEVDARLDTLREELGGFTRTELSRFVRVWNKSRKVRYKL